MVLNDYARNFITKLTITVQTFNSLQSISAQIGTLQLYDIYARAEDEVNKLCLECSIDTQSSSCKLFSSCSYCRICKYPIIHGWIIHNIGPLITLSSLSYFNSNYISCSIKSQSFSLNDKCKRVWSRAAKQCGNVNSRISCFTWEPHLFQAFIKNAMLCIKRAKCKFNNHGENLPLGS